MRNFIKIGVLACAISSFALAEGAFIGVEGGYLFNSQISGDSGAKIKGKAPNIGIKGGYAWDEARAYVQYNHVFEAKKTFEIDKEDEEVKWDNDEFLVGADWTPAINDSAKFVLGGYSGVSVLNVKADDGWQRRLWLLGSLARNLAVKISTIWRRNLVAIMWQFSGKSRHDGMGKFVAVIKKFFTFLWLNSYNYEKFDAVAFAEQNSHITTASLNFKTNSSFKQLALAHIITTVCMPNRL